MLPQHFMALTLMRLETTGQVLRNMLLFKQYRVFVFTMTNIAQNWFELTMNTIPDMPTLNERFLKQLRS